MCDKLAQQAWDRGFAVDSIHGDREQWERTKVRRNAIAKLAIGSGAPSARTPTLRLGLALLQMMLCLRDPS